MQPTSILLTKAVNCPLTTDGLQIGKLGFHSVKESNLEAAEGASRAAHRASSIVLWPFLNADEASPRHWELITPALRVSAPHQSQIGASCGRTLSTTKSRTLSVVGVFRLKRSLAHQTIRHWDDIYSVHASPSVCRTQVKMFPNDQVYQAPEDTPWCFRLNTSCGKCSSSDVLFQFFINEFFDGNVNIHWAQNNEEPEIASSAETNLALPWTLLLFSNAWAEKATNNRQSFSTSIQK